MTDTEIPATRRSESTSEESSARSDPLHGSAEIENTQTMTKNYREMSCKVCQMGNWSSSMDRLMKVFQNINTLPVLLMNYLWSREQKWYRVNRTFSLISRKTGIAISVRGRKLRGLLAEDAPVQSCPELNILVILKSADHKDLSEGCESRKFHRYAVVVFRLRYSVDTIIPMENEKISGNTKEVAEVLGADQETKSHLH